MQFEKSNLLRRLLPIKSIHHTEPLDINIAILLYNLIEIMPVVRMIEEILSMDVSKLTIIVISGLKPTGKNIIAGGGNKVDTKLAMVSDRVIICVWKKSLSKMASSG